jgi:hypothetical protein
MHYHLVDLTKCCNLAINFSLMFYMLEINFCTYFYDILMILWIYGKE